jgi:hypothetical protein
MGSLHSWPLTGIIVCGDDKFVDSLRVTALENTSTRQIIRFEEVVYRAHSDNSSSAENNVQARFTSGLQHATLGGSRQSSVELQKVGPQSNQNTTMV